MPSPLPANNPLYPRSLFPQAVDVINDLATPAVSDAISATQAYLLGTQPVTFSGPVASSNAIKPGNTAVPGGSLWSGSGVPAPGLGGNGDYYFRTDTPATSLQRIYVKSAGAWVGIV